MNKCLVHMVAVDGSYNHSSTAQLSANTWKYWAEKNNVDFIMDTESDPRFKNAIWNKFLMFKRFPNYDKYVSIDCDTMIKWDAPNFFDQMENDIFYAVNDLSSLRWIKQSINDRQKWFPNIKLDYETYWNSGVIWCTKHHEKMFDDMIEIYLNNKEEFDNWNKGGGVVQTLLNFIFTKRNYKLKLIPPVWNLFSMHKTEMFSHNWQDGEDKTPFFIKYAYIWHFTGFAIEQRLNVMQQVWDLYSQKYN